MYKTGLGFLFMILVYGGSSQTKDTILLWANKATVAQDLNPSTIKGWYEGIFEVNTPLLLAYLPKEELDKKVAVVVCPGGGFTHLSIKKEGYEIAEWLNSLGITAFVLQYSVPDKKAQAVYDIQRAMKLVRYNADKWGISPQKIGVIGFSAGGNLCARISCVPDTNFYDAVDVADAVSSLPNFALLIYSGGLGRKTDGKLSSHLSFGKDTPPMFIFGAADDDVTNYGSLFLTQELYRKEVPVELHILPEGGHGYGLRPANVAARTWPPLAEKWLYRYILN